MTARMSKRAYSELDSEVCPLPPVLDPGREHYPFCVVWTPIPLLSWLLPFVGHIGICDSQGRIYDFQGNFSIGDDRMLFGNPVRYWDVSKLFVPSFYASGGGSLDSNSAGAVAREVEQYDKAIFNTIQHFRRSERYNFFANNCHSFVASCLNSQPHNHRKYNMVAVCLQMLCNGHYISCGRAAKALGPFLFLCAVVIILVSVLSTAL